MNNEQKIALYNQLSKKSNYLLDNNRLEERNKLTSQIVSLYRSIDWGFKEKETVYLVIRKKYIPSIIKEITEDNYFFIKKLSGGEEIVPACLLRKYDVIEQLNLFESEC